MKLKMYQIDAFAEKLFEGNPAAVVPLREWLTDEVMQQIANENNLAETAFFVPENGMFHIRWFTPSTEVELCGHATLASAHVLYEHLGYGFDQCTFQTNNRGALIVIRSDTGLTMDFPADTPATVSNETVLAMSRLLGLSIQDVQKGTDDYLVAVAHHSMVTGYQPDFRAIAEWDARGIILTSPGYSPYDFISRCFFPQFGIDEDPVTGSAHTLLTPYWSAKLGKTKMRAQQASSRTGKLVCEMKGDRVLLGGTAKTYLIGEIHLD